MAGDCDISTIAKELDSGNGNELSWINLCWGQKVRADHKYDPLTRGSYDPKDMTDENLGRLVGEAVKEKGDWLQSIKALQSPGALCTLEIKNVPLLPGRPETIVDAEVNGPHCKK